MGTGTDLKADVDALRDLLGSDCTLNGTTALGKCAVRELDPSGARASLGEQFIDEVDLPWAWIETPAGSGIKEGDRITVDTTGDIWIVRRIKQPMAGDVVLAERCLCVATTV